MTTIEIDYDELGVAGAAYLAILASQEAAVRNGLIALGRSGRFNWRCAADKHDHLVFRLVFGSRPDDWLGRFLPLDFTLGSDDFTKLIVERVRSSP